jgi:tRNA threonylcarbamoyladenosine biosynthesis protein TsaB
LIAPIRPLTNQMLLLAADTSGKHGSIALARVPHQSAKSSEIEIIEVVPLAGGTFSAQLVPQIAALLSRHGFKKEEIDAFAVASGPGSFTGLRVGLAAIKALAEVMHKPIAAVSLLEAVARMGTGRGKVMAALDAGRGEVYVGEYQIAAEGTLCLGERLLTVAELAAAAARETVVTPNEILYNQLKARGVTMEKIEHPRSDAIARLGWAKLQGGETVSPEELEANYIRRSDAEIFSKTSS